MARRILVVNTSFPEINHLAAALAEEGLLARYVRLYANLDRPWERAVARLPGVGAAYRRTLGRRTMPKGLRQVDLYQAGLGLDLAMALHARIPIRFGPWRRLRETLMYRLGEAVAQAGARLLSDEEMVVGSWLSALPAFEKAERFGLVRVLNYPLAHHRFTRRLLEEEALLEPSFASTLDNVDRPEWVAERLDRVVALADRILVGSTFVKRSFEAEGVSAEKLTVVPYGADTHLFSPAEERAATGEFRMVFAGQIGQRKGISYLLRAYRSFRGPGTSLTLIGRFQGDGVAFTPWRDDFNHVDHLPRTRLAQEFRRADAFVFPTLVEGMGLVVVEAMASGLPVITTANGPGDLVRDGVDGFIVPVRDVDAIVNRLERLRGDPGLRAAMATNARRRALEFTWEHYRRSVVSHIHRWLGPGRR